MGKKYQKLVNAFAAVFMLAGVFSLTGCGTAENMDLQTGIEEMSVDLEVQRENPEVRTDGDIAFNTTRKTEEEYAAEDRARRASLEEQVKAAGGISEEEAIEIAKNALKTDLGDRGKELELVIDEAYGWSSDLCVADWSEIKEKDKGATAYSIGFTNAKEGMEVDELLNYVCVVNAVDGSILEAYTIQGLGDNTVYYEH